MAPILSDDESVINRDLNVNPFRDTSREVKKLIRKDFSEDVLRSVEVIDEVLDIGKEGEI